MVIVRAAIMFDNGEIVEGHDYGHISTLAHKLSYRGDKVYGFLTSTGEFVLPDDAAEIALKANQIAGDVKWLTPTMLWPYIKDDE